MAIVLAFQADQRPLEAFCELLGRLFVRSRVKETGYVAGYLTIAAMEDGTIENSGGDKRWVVLEQSVLEKAEITLEKQNLCLVGSEAAKVQISELASNMKEIPDPHNLKVNPIQFSDCSIKSCLTTSEGSKMDGAMHCTNMILRAYHGNLSQSKAQMEKNSRLEQIQSTWYRELKGQERDPGILSMSITNQKDKEEGNNISKALHMKREKEDDYLEEPGHGRAPPQQKSSEKFSDHGLGTQLDLNVQDANNHAAPDYREFDLNCFSWG